MCGRWVGVHGLRSTVVCVHELELSIQPPAVAKTSRTSSLTQCTNTTNKLDRLPPLECYITHSIVQDYITATRGCGHYSTATRGCGQLHYCNKGVWLLH